MAVSDWSTTPSANTVIEGISIAENCPAANINNVLRAICAAIKVMYSSIPNVANLMPKAGGAFTGDINKSGKGGYLYHANAAATNGAIYFLPEGATRPAAAEGVIIFYY